MKGTAHKRTFVPKTGGYDHNVDLSQLAIVDCHLHFLDAQVNRYPIFEERSAAFETIVGDYAALPQCYRPEDYLKDTKGFHIVKSVCAEFISEAPVEEIRWLRNLSDKTGHPSRVIARAEFMSPNIQHLLNAYLSIGRVCAIREHLAWHPTNPLLCFATRPDLLCDATWRKGVGLLREYNLCCEVEIFAPQLPDLTAAAKFCSDVQFILPLMGWPLDLTKEGYRAWKRDMTALSHCENVAVKIFGMECIFGLQWKIEQVRRWILDVIALFGAGRCMFASHMPITLLSCSFKQLYSAYLELVSDFSPSEKDQLFHDTAVKLYGL